MNFWVFPYYIYSYKKVISTDEIILYLFFGKEGVFIHHTLKNGMSHWAFLFCLMNRRHGEKIRISGRKGYCR